MATIVRQSWPINWRRHGSQFDVESAPIAGRSGHDRTAIVSHDRGSNVIDVVRYDQVGWAVPIARSSSSSICRPMEIHRSMKCPPSDGDLTLHASPQREEDRAFPWPSDRDRAAFTLMKISAPRVATWQPVSSPIAATYSGFHARA